MGLRLSRWIVTLALLALASAGPTWAADPKKAPPEASAEQRLKMAEVHEKMAECLRSSRPMTECRSEMAAACQYMLGASASPMMGRGRGGMGPGMMGSSSGMGPGHMMQGPPTSTPPPDTPKK